jgi:hypothetical protein
MWFLVYAPEFKEGTVFEYIQIGRLCGRDLECKPSIKALHIGKKNANVQLIESLESSSCFLSTSEKRASIPAVVLCVLNVKMTRAYFKQSSKGFRKPLVPREKHVYDDYSVSSFISYYYLSRKPSSSYFLPNNHNHRVIKTGEALKVIMEE